MPRELRAVIILTANGDGPVLRSLLRLLARTLRVVFAVCALCFALAIYSGHRIVAETHLHTSDGPSPVPGVSKGPYRDSLASLEQEQRIRASRLVTAENSSVGRHRYDDMMGAMGGR